VGHDLAGWRGHARGETEGGGSPLEVGRLTVRLEGEPFTDGGVIDLREGGGKRGKVSVRMRKKGKEGRREEG
jgi:hypothetical protein